MTNTPETDELRDDVWASVYIEGQDFMQMLEHARRLERERDKLAEVLRSSAPSALTIDWQAGPYPDTMRVVLATDGENIYVATYTKDDGWQDAHTCEDIDYYITYWAEMPALPQV
jgi:hypothetical protein